MKTQSSSHRDNAAPPTTGFIHAGLTPEDMANDLGVSDEGIRAYGRDVVTLLGCTNEEAVVIEDLMRSEVFHSTLDWQSEQQFEWGARKAQAMLAGDREFFLRAYAERRALFRKQRRQREAKETTPTHEI